MSRLGSQLVSKLQASIGRTGSWRIEGWGDQGLALTGRQTLAVGDLQFLGAVLRGDTDAPDAPHWVHVGAPGWDTPIVGTLSYQNDNGIRLRTVLTDLAKRAGEPIELPPDLTIGKHWCVIASREGETLRLRDALTALARGRYVKPWRVDLDGVTRFGERVMGVADSAAAHVIKRDSAAGWALCGADAFASLLPGATFEGAIVERLVITETPGNLAAEVWTRAPSAMTSILRKVGEAFPALVYGYPRTYRVGAVGSDGRLDLDAPADAAHLPSLQRVEVWGLGGAKVKPALGSLVVVHFRDANPSRPTVIALQPLANSTPTETTIDADALKLGAGEATVIRAGDKIAIDTTPGPTLGTVSFIGTSIAAHSKVSA